MSNLPQEDYDYAEVIGRNLQRLICERGTTQAALICNTITCSVYIGSNIIWINSDDVTKCTVTL